MMYIRMHVINCIDIMNASLRMQIIAKILLAYCFLMSAATKSSRDGSYIQTLSYYLDISIFHFVSIKCFTLRSLE